MRIVWVRGDRDEIVTLHCHPSDPTEVARDGLSMPTRPVIDDGHYPRLEVHGALAHSAYVGLRRR